MTRKPYATRRIGPLDAILARRFRSRRRLMPLMSRVPRWWTTRGWRARRQLAGSGLRLQDARRMRLWCMADRSLLPPMLPEPARPVPPSWRADR